MTTTTKAVALAGAIVMAALVRVPIATAGPDAATIKEARTAFEKGDAAYNLGRFDEAVTWFTKAYEIWPVPDFLYNIAQSYRQAGNCKQALFSYRRYLSLKDKDKEAPLSKKERAEIERLIKEVDACAAKAESSASKPPDGLKGTPTTPPAAPPPAETTPPTPPPTEKTTPTPSITTPSTSSVPTPVVTPTAPVATPSTTPTAPTTPPRVATATPIPSRVEPSKPVPIDESDDELVDVGEPSPAMKTPSVVSARLMAGVTKLGTGKLFVPIQPAFMFSAGYPLALGSATFEFGGGVSFSPIQYDTMDDTKHASFIGVRATLGVTYMLRPSIGLRGDVGVGMARLGGLAEGNPFTDDRHPGSFTMLSIRVGVAADYAVTSKVFATISPFAFTFSPAPARLYMGSLKAIDIAIGVGYRM